MGTSGSRTPWSQGPISGLSKLQIPLKHRTPSAYNWDLGIIVPVKTQKCSDNYQNMRIMLAVLRFKNKRNYAKNYANTVYRLKANRR